MADLVNEPSHSPTSCSPPEANSNSEQVESVEQILNSVREESLDDISKQTAQGKPYQVCFSRAVSSILNVRATFKSRESHILSLSLSFLSLSVSSTAAPSLASSVSLALLAVPDGVNMTLPKG